MHEDDYGSALAPVRRTGWLALAAAVLTVGLIAYGSWVRVSGSGLGCPDWPLCEGGVLPTLEGDTAIEFGHRFYAGVTMLVVAAAAWSGFASRRADGLLAKVIVGAFAAILLQAALGGATVLTELDGMVRLAHLSIAMLTLALLTGAAIRGLGIPGSDSPGLPVATGLLLGAGFVVLLGGSIVGVGLSFGCPGLPLCDDRSPTDAAWLHAIHRTAAVLLLAALIATAVRLRKRRGTVFAIGLNHGAAFLVLAQIGVGVSAVVQTLPDGLRVLHLAIATLIWWAIVAQWALALKVRSA